MNSLNEESVVIIVSQSHINIHIRNACLSLFVK